jgi:hypothetical protein
MTQISLKKILGNSIKPTKKQAETAIPLTLLLILHGDAGSAHGESYGFFGAGCEQQQSRHQEVPVGVDWFSSLRHAGTYR